jgi:hypothetical protein
LPGSPALAGPHEAVACESTGFLLLQKEKRQTLRKERYIEGLDEDLADLPGRLDREMLRVR